MHAYFVYGLALLSDLPIPELLPAASRQSGEPLPTAEPCRLRHDPASDASADIVVMRGPIPNDWSTTFVPRADRTPKRADGDEPDSWSERRANANETLCVFAGVGRYLVQGGRSITVEPEADVDEAFVRHLLLGPVLAHLLWQRGVFTLHASVVGISGYNVGFVGVSGEGKSTTAAALESRGHALICDDVAALTERVGRLHVLPAFPRIRLYADSVESVGDDPARHPQVHPQIDKRSKGVRSFGAEVVPLHRLYVLATGDELRIERLAPREALMEVLRHTYYAHQYAPLYGFKRQLDQAADVVMRVGVFRLTRPKDLALLPKLVGLLEARAKAESAESQAG